MLCYKDFNIAPNLLVLQAISCFYFFVLYYGFQQEHILDIQAAEHWLEYGISLIGLGNTRSRFHPCYSDLICKFTANLPAAIHV